MCRKNAAPKQNESIPVSVNKFPVVPENINNPNVVFTTHILCRDCILTLKGDMIRKSKSGELSSNTKIYNFKCAVCIKHVHKVEIKFLKPLLKSQDGACCNIL